MAGAPSEDDPVETMRQVMAAQVRHEKYPHDPRAAEEALRRDPNLAGLGLPEHYFVGAQERLDQDTENTWLLARLIASRYLRRAGLDDLVPVILQARLALAHADRWTMSTTAFNGCYIVTVDAGFRGALSRVGRFLGFYWAWDFPGPEHIRSQPQFPGPAVMERMFRLYFTEFRWAGYFTNALSVHEPPDGTGLGAAAAHTAFLFAVLHELAHVILTEQRQKEATAPEEELQCDRLACEMLAQVHSARLLVPQAPEVVALTANVPAPGLMALGVRHHFQTLRAIESAYYMIRPTATYPTAAERERAALATLRELRGIRDASRWSKDVARPIEALVDLVTTAPPPSRMLPTGLPESPTIPQLIEAMQPRFIPLERAGGAEMLDELERLDQMAFVPAELLRAMFPKGFAAPEGSAPNWAEPILTALDAASGREVRDIRERGLPFSLVGKVSPLAGLDGVARVALWAVHTTEKYGWDPGFMVRSWGTTSGGIPPRILVEPGMIGPGKDLCRSKMS
jgi:hypothetical protein